MARKTIPLLILISAPSGAGKTTLVQQIISVRPDIRRAVTCTTRPPRAGESDGIDYHFLTESQFKQGLGAGKFIEHASVYGFSYGLMRSEVLKKLRAGSDVVINVDVQGAATIRAKARKDPELGRSLITLFLTPPTLEVLEKRLRKRGADSEETIARRLRAAKRELKQWSRFDYLLISDTVEADLSRAIAIIDAEKMRCHRSKPPAMSPAP
jgi:guanylate kinase